MILVDMYNEIIRVYGPIDPDLVNEIESEHVGFTTQYLTDKWYTNKD